MNNISKLLGLVGLISLVNFISANFPVFGFIILYLCVGYVVDQICIKIGDVEAEHRTKERGYTTYKCQNVYKETVPLRGIAYLLPLAMLIVTVMAEYKHIRTAFPQIPKFRNPFYYD